MTAADHRRTKADLIAELEELRAGSVAVRDRTRTGHAVDEVAASVRSTTGDAFMRALVLSLTRTLGVRYAFVVEPVDGESQRLRSIVAAAGDAIVPNIAYDAAGTPCERVMSGEVCVFPANVQQLFPDDALLAEMNAASYVAAPLIDPAQRRIGLLAVVHDAPLADPDTVRTVLERFAIRAGTELERRRAEAALTRAQRVMTAAERVGQFGSFVWDITSGEVQWSPGMYVLYGTDPATAPPITFEFAMSVVHPDDAGVIARQVSDALAGSGRAEVRYRIRRPDGSVRTLWGQSEVERNAAGAPVALVGTVHDWTDRAAADEALRTSEERFRSLVESASFGIYRSTVDGRFLAVNGALVAMLGYESSEELLRANVASIYRRPPDRAELIAANSAGGPIGPVEVEWVRKDGSPLTVRLRGTRTTDTDGADRFTMTVEDVTTQRHLEHQLRHAQKMEGVGRLAGGIAHDFNNILTAITSYADLLLTDMHVSGEHRADVAEIRRAADRAAALTRQLLAFSRQQVLSPRVLDLNTVVAGMGNMLVRIIGEDVTLTTELRATKHVRADPAQLEQVLLNLVVNARDAVREGERITISTEDRCVEAGDRGPASVVPPGAYVLLSVLDSGIGMDTDTLAHAFDPFFTTKPPGKGTGLGLATVYGVVKQSGGYVLAASEPAAGTRIDVYLPVVAATAEWPLPAVGPHRANTGRETVLLVEDDAGVRHAATLALQRAGYTVMAASDPHEAVAIGRDAIGTIDLLFTDVVMPGMGGRQLCETLRRDKPSLPVLYMSGYPGGSDTRDRLLEPGAPFLAKPFTAESLADAVRGALDGVAPAATNG